MVHRVHSGKLPDLRPALRAPRSRRADPASASPPTPAAAPVAPLLPFSAVLSGIGRAPAAAQPTSSIPPPADSADGARAAVATSYASVLDRVRTGWLDPSHAVGRMMREGVDGTLAQQLVNAARAAGTARPAAPPLPLLDPAAISDPGLRAAVAQVSADGRLSAREKDEAMRPLQIAATEKEVARALQDNAAAIAAPLATERLSAQDAVAQVMTTSGVSRAIAEEAVRRLGGEV